MTWKQTKDVLIMVAVALFLLWNPFTRQAILFVLPLGSGIDDLVFLVLLAVTLVFGLVYYIQRRRLR